MHADVRVHNSFLFFCSFASQLTLNGARLCWLWFEEIFVLKLYAGRFFLEPLFTHFCLLCYTFGGFALDGERDKPIPAEGIWITISQGVQNKLGFCLKICCAHGHPDLSH